MRRTATGEAVLAGRHPFLLLDHTLAIDAVARERQGLQPLVTDGLAAALAVAERAVVDLLQRRHDVAEDPAVAVAELEKELARIGGVGLIAEILDGVIFLVLNVQRRAADFVGELPVLLDQAL